VHLKWIRDVKITRYQEGRMHNSIRKLSSLQQVVRARPLLQLCPTHSCGALMAEIWLVTSSLAYFPEVGLCDLLPLCVSMCVPPPPLLGNGVTPSTRGGMGLSAQALDSAEHRTSSSSLRRRPNIVCVERLHTTNISDRTEERTQTQRQVGDRIRLL
jgi:hypothetical protein